MAITDMQKNDGMVLLELYRKQIEQQLIEQLTKDMRPRVEAAAREALKELQVAVEQRVNHLRAEMVTHFELSFK